MFRRSVGHSLTGLLLIALVLIARGNPALAGNFAVSTTTDGVAGSLRAAIIAANGSSGPSRVEVTLTGTGGTGLR